MHPLNPEAGDVPYPRDPLVLAAAVRGGETSWQAWPYLDARYGERGRRFRASDSAWLATLGEHGEATATQQLLWLASVLGARGIPSIVLSHRAYAVVQALREDLPDGAARWDVIQHAANVLSAQQLANGADPAALHAAGARCVEAGAHPLADNLGQLALCAWADKAAGRSRAPETLLEWVSAAELPQQLITTVTSIATTGAA